LINHYKALRSSIGDFRNKIPKEVVSGIFNRANPLQWMNYSNAKLAISLVLMGSGPPMSQKIKNSLYENDRNPGVASVWDTSKLRIGRHSLVNRLRCLKAVKCKWMNGINEHALRIGLKQMFLNFFFAFLTHTNFF